MTKEVNKFMAKAKVENEPCNEVLALGHLMKEWLENQIADAGTYVDTGKGFYEYDLWVHCEGKELYINIKEKKPT